MKFAINHIKVDIVLPNYNSYPFIEETIKSIINQTFTNWELFIVDGNSNNETQKILKKYEKYENIKIIWLKKNKRAGFCRNLAIRKSKSRYVAFIDSDDIWEKDKLLKQLTFMEKNNYLFTYTNYSAFKNSNKSNDTKVIFPPALFSFEEFIKNTSIGTSTMIIKKSSIGNVKFSNTKICEDYFFKCQILKKVNYAHCLPESLTRYRIRKNSLQSKKIRNLYWIWHINKNYNHLSFIKNLLSVICISINSLKKYGFK
jgi:teichuronic acid biosynthesis glycosyltransferase TuaG